MSSSPTLRIGTAAAVSLLLASCAGAPSSPAPRPPPPPAPFYVDAGVGSEHGNFLAIQDGERVGPGGVRCATYIWDRPLTAQTALRLRSESCEVAGHPGMYTAHELERMEIPMASSPLLRKD